jgi:hypothetical protein
MDDMELAYYDAEYKKLEEQAEAAIKVGQKFENLLKTPGYQLAKDYITKDFIQRTPSIPANSDAPLKAYGYLRFIEGIEFFFKYAELAVQRKAAAEEAMRQIH